MDSAQDIPDDVVIKSVLEIFQYSEMEITGTIPKQSVHKTWIVEEAKKIQNVAMFARAVVHPVIDSLRCYLVLCVISV